METREFIGASKRPPIKKEAIPRVGNNKNNQRMLNKTFGPNKLFTEDKKPIGLPAFVLGALNKNNLVFTYLSGRKYLVHKVSGSHERMIRMPEQDTLVADVKRILDIDLSKDINVEKWKSMKGIN